MNTPLAEQLSMIYHAPTPEEGLQVVLRSFIRREERRIKAVRHLSFAIGAGVVAGFIEPNGAVKTTTLKLLSGVVRPINCTVRHARPSSRAGRQA